MPAELSCFLPVYVIVKSTESVFNASHNMPTPVQEKDYRTPRANTLSFQKCTVEEITVPQLRVSGEKHT